MFTIKMKYFLIFISLGFYSCSKSIWIDQEPNVSISNFETFSWNGIKTGEGHSYYMKNNIDGSIKSLIDKTLAEKGYHESSTQKGDFFIDFHVFIKADYFQQDYCPTGFYGNRGYIDQITPGPVCNVPLKTATFDSGTLVIDIVDTRSGQIIWRGNVFGLIENPRFAPEIFEKKVKRLLKKFPVQARMVKS